MKQMFRNWVGRSFLAENVDGHKASEQAIRECLENVGLALVYGEEGDGPPGMRDDYGYIGGIEQYGAWPPLKYTIELTVWEDANGTVEVRAEVDDPVMPNVTGGLT